MTLRKDPGNPVQTGLPGSVPSLQPQERQQEARRVGLSVCGHPLTVEAQKAIQTGLDVVGWSCRVCGTWRQINVYPDNMQAELLF